MEETEISDFLWTYQKTDIAGKTVTGESGEVETNWEEFLNGKSDK